VYDLGDWFTQTNCTSFLEDNSHPENTTWRP